LPAAPPLPVEDAGQRALELYLTDQSREALELFRQLRRQRAEDPLLAYRIYQCLDELHAPAAEREEARRVALRLLQHGAARDDLASTYYLAMLESTVDPERANARLERLLQGWLERPPSSSTVFELTRILWAMRHLDRLDEADSVLRRVFEAEQGAWIDPPRLRFVGPLLYPIGRETGSLAEIEARLDDALRRRPDSIALHVVHADFLWSGGRRLDAARALARIERLRPQSVEDRYRTGWLLLELGRPGDAVRHLEGARALAPYHDPTLYALGRAYELTEEPASAEEVLRELVTLVPDHAPAVTRLARAVGSQERHDEASALYRRAIELDPEDQWIRRDRAIHAFYRGEPDLALRGLAAIERPELGTLQLRIRLLRELGRWSDAIDVARGALIDHPEDRLLLSALADAYQRRGGDEDWELARDTWERIAGEGDDDEARAWAAASRALFAAAAHAAGRHEMGRQASLAGLEAAETPMLRATLAACLEGLGRYGEATTEWARAIADPRLGLEAAVSFRDSGHDELAERVLQIVVERRPDFAGAWRELGILCVESGRFDDAAGALGQALWLDPGDPRAIDALIRAAAHSPEAARLLRRHGG
jgi:tetratricopeptide (TPR) repeat protein